INHINVDSVRAEIDRRLCVEVLGLPPTIAKSGGELDLLRAKLAQEPAIRGHKEKSRAIVPI
ncbi:MAG: hypothetical protein ABI743_15375, partial [bacterium]